MDITIGRDGATSRLSITTGQNTSIVGAPQSVPLSVSRKHCTITINNDGTMRIKNINPQNVTFVNGSKVMSMAINRGDRIELGQDRYLLDWKNIDAGLPKVADIRPLCKVWETYVNGTKEVTMRKQRFQVLRGIVPIFTMSAVLIGYLSGGRGVPFFIIYALVIALTVFFVIKSWMDIPKDDEQINEIKERFSRNYCCPECGYFFGFTDYSILTKNMDYCPKCKTKLLK